MDPERWQRIKEVLHTALEREPGARAAFLNEACAGDSSLRNEVETLLASHEQAGGFIESPAFELMAHSLGESQSIVGSDLGPYRVTGRLGAGGMGEVYLAEDTRLGRKVALKVLLAHFTSDEERVRRFQQEARSASALNHPNIVTIHEIGEIASRHFIVTEVIEGDTLRRYLSKAPIAISEALDIAIQIASALSAAHAAAIVHRDIKPDNVMLRTDGIVKVLDFGLAKLTERKAIPSESPPLVNTAQGMVMGTAHYMSPEQARGLAVDIRTDIWSLGVVFYEMIGGRVPFEGATSSDVIAAILEREPTSLARYAPEVPTELEWIVKKALRKDCEERYQTAKELLSDLKSLKHRLEFEQELERSMDSGPRSADLARGPGFVSSKDNRAQRQSQGAQSHSGIDSLAILPLTNASPDPNLEYLSDGITESIINSLSQLPHIRVMGRSSVFRYKGRDVGPKEIGRELGVRAVLTGRVLQVGERLVVGTELIDATDETQLWGKHYNRDLSDIFEVQEEIAHEISEALRLRLSGKEQKRLAKRYTENTEAYQLYLKGLHFFNKRAVEGYKKAIEYYQQAIEIDPNYALAYAGLADCYANSSFAEISPKDAIIKARTAAMKALEIDDTLAEAHNALAHVRVNLDWDWSGAEEEFKLALELNPNYAEAHHRYSHYLVAMGRFEESLTESFRCLELDPLALIMNAHLGWHYLMARQDDQAIEQLKRTLELDKSFINARLYLGQAYERKGMCAKAIEEIHKVRTLYGPSQIASGLLGHAYAVAGKKDLAEKTIEELKEQSKREYVWPYNIAIIHVGLGEKDQAFEWLEKACEDRSDDLIYLRVEPMFDPLRSDLRFKDLVRRIGLLSVESIQPATLSSEKQSTETTRGQAASLTTRGAWHVSAEADRAGSQSQGRQSRQIDSLAIIPLTNNTADPGMEYLSDGISESMISALSQLPELRVMAWSTVSRYKDKEIDPRDAGRELNVRAVLTGRVMKSGSLLVIKTELVDANDGSHLWGEQFSCMPSDILDVEAEISRAISEKLMIRLTTEARKQLTKRYTETTAAYHLYLKGRYHWNKRSEEALHKSIECFQQAIEIDPNYALAYAGLADCYTKLGDVGVTAMLPKEAFMRARAAALRALRIDNSLAEVHASLGHIDMHQLRWADAERDFKRAIDLNPNYATAHHWYAYYLAFHHRLDEALEKIEVALELDPLSLPIADSVGEFLYFARRYDEAIAQFRKTLEMEPNFLASLINLGRAYEQSRMFTEAEDQFAKARQIAGESIDALAALGHTYAMSGSTGAALEVLAQLTELSKERYVSPYDIALIHTALGESDEAFRWLEKAYDECVEWMIYTNVDPRLDPLRSDARFPNLMRRIGFDPTDSFHRGTPSSERQRK